METKDYFTIGLSGAAILISLGSAIFSYWQYGLNRDRDIREQKKAAEDAAKELESRNPVIHFEAKRDGDRRRFIVKFSFENRSYADVRVTSVNFWTDKGLLINPSIRQPGSVAVYVPEFMARSPDSNVIDDGLPSLPIGGNADWYCFVTVPDSVGIYPHMPTTFTFSIKFRDAADTTTTIRRIVELP